MSTFGLHWTQQTGGSNAIHWIDIPRILHADPPGCTPGQSWEAILEQWVGLARAAWNGERRPKWKIHALNRLFFDELRLKAVSAADDPQAMYLENVLVRGGGNCLGLSLLYLVCAEACGARFTPVLAARHVFVRYEGMDRSRNIETVRRGREFPDSHYLRKYGTDEEPVELRVLSPVEFLGVLLVSRVAYEHIPRCDWKRAERDLDVAVSLFSDCPCVSINRSVIRQNNEMLQ